MNSKEIIDAYGYEKKGAWEALDQPATEELSQAYRTFLDRGKTERECILEIEKMARKQGFAVYEGGRLKPGERFFIRNKGKGLLLGVAGNKTLTEGIQLVGAHVDVPRLDLKAQPLYEEEGMGLLKTHYYGGIKKYQWTSIPLAIHGVIVPMDKEPLTFQWGEDPQGPVFTITDLLPHLAREQMKKPMSEAVEGESLNVLFGGKPLADPEGEKRVKANLLKLIHDELGVKEEDLISAEIEVVPAGPCREVGLDRAFIGGYGHDDRVCAFSAVTALFAVREPARTALVLLTDKEEIGSTGDTGAQSMFLEHALALLAQGEGLQGLGDPGRILNRSIAVSADVSAAQDPNYPNLFDPKNAPSAGMGVVLTKYTGARGKYDANDASAETMGALRRLFHRRGVIWQTGELGKVDMGGGGTIAMFLSRLGMDTVDCGPALLGMHSPFEIVSKADLYMTVQAYSAFLQEEVAQ